MIKYIGSKRRLVPALGQIAEARAPAPRSTCSPARRASRRSSSGSERTSPRSTALATPRCSHGATSRPTSTASTRPPSRPSSPASTSSPGPTGLRHRDVLRASRYFHPDNGARIDAIRDAIAADHAGSPLEPLLLTSLIEAADRVDSTTGVQMAYLKQWAPRSHQRLELRAPALLRGRRSSGARRRGRAGDARSDRSTSPTSTRPTTSTGTSRTTTCGRRWSRGTRPRTTASPASASTAAMTVDQERVQLEAHDARTRWRAVIAASTPSSWWCRTTTRRG